MTTYGDNFYGYGLPNPDVLMRDYQHANRMYVANYYRLLPKYKTLYSVLVRPNPEVVRQIKTLSKGTGGTRGDGLIGSIQQVMDTVKDVIDTPTRMMDTIFGDVSEGTKVRELSALAKRVELPSFNISLDEKNQYNKKVPIMTGLKYDPINISFYDDNNNTTINLINNYYKYFFGDGNVPKSAAFRPDVVKQERNFNSWGLQARAMKDFFLAIDVYSFNRGTFTMHSMKSPYIMSIKMGDHEYGSYEPRDINIQIGYSSIVYASGYIKRGTPPGFADLIYDFNPSPLTGKYPTNLYDALGESASALGGLFGGTSNIQSFITPIQQFSVGGVNTNMPSTIPLVPGNILSAFNTGQSGMRTSTPNGQPVSIGGMQGSGQVVGGGLPGPATPTAGSISVSSLPTLK